MCDRLKRIIAFVLDGGITLFLFVFVFLCFVDSIQQPESIFSILYVLFLTMLILNLIVFAFRDVIFKGRSLCKRIFGLYVVDKNRLTKASVKQCFLRNLFFFIYPVDGVILMITGETIGDRVADTLVLSKKRLKVAGL